MNPERISLITNYIYNDRPYSGTITRSLMKELYEEYTTLRSVLAYYSHPNTYQALNGIDVLKDAGKRARAVTGISSTSEKLPGNPEEETV